MIRGLRVDPSDATPIWRQIEDGVRRLAASRGLAPGEVLPSVRDLARALRVNPATVAKAYQRLTDAGVLTVRRGEGTYVAETPPTLARADRKRILEEGAERFVSMAVTVGASSEETASAVTSAWARLTGAATRRSRT